MKELIETLYSIPLDVFRSYVLLKPLYQSDTLLASLVEAEAIQAGLALSELQKPHDILQAALEKFNHRLQGYWREQHPEIPSEQRVSLSEDDRQAMMQLVLQTYLTEYYIDATLLEKINTLINTYHAVNEGYSAFSLTSIYTALKVASDNQSYFRFFVKKPTLLTWEDEAVWKVYAALTKTGVSHQIRLIRKLLEHCQSLEKMIEGYIDEYILTMVVTINKPVLVDNADAVSDFPDCAVSEENVQTMLEFYPDLQVALQLSNCLTMLSVCLSSKGKHAGERVALFHQLWCEQMRGIPASENPTLDQAVARFNQAISVLFSAVQLPQQALFAVAASPPPPVVKFVVGNVVNRPRQY